VIPWAPPQPVHPVRRIADFGAAREIDGSVRLTRYHSDGTSQSWILPGEDWAAFVAHVSAHTATPHAIARAKWFHEGGPP